MVSLNRITAIVRRPTRLATRPASTLHRRWSTDPAATMSRFARRLPIGAEVQPDGSPHSRVWAPEPRDVRLVIEGRGLRQELPMNREPDGYYSTVVSGTGDGDLYRFWLDG